MNTRTDASPAGPGRSNDDGAMPAPALGWRVGEAARYLGVSPYTIYRWESAGKISPVPRDAAGHRRFSDRLIAAIRATMGAST